MLMNMVTKRIIMIAVMAALTFTGFSVASGIEVDAASKPGKVYRINATGITVNSATISWGKVKKGINGYSIIRNGRTIKNVGPKAMAYRDTELRGSTRYTYYVKAYKNVRQKQWFNKKTKKWQAKKPAKKYRGKARTVRVKVYGAASPRCVFTTKSPAAKSWTAYGRTVTSNQCPVTFVQEGTRCRICGAGGVTVRITYSNGGFSASTSGNDYSRKCHHHNNIPFLACLGEHTTANPTVEQVTRYGRYFGFTDINSNSDPTREEDTDEIYLATGQKKGTQTRKLHSHVYPDRSYDDLETTSGGVICKEKYFVKMYYCKDCKKIVVRQDDWK